MSDQHGAQAASDRAAREHRVRYSELFDAELRPHNERFRAAAGVAPRDRVLDIGCGTGQSTREAARAAVAGDALGVDISAESLELARMLSEKERLQNVTYLHADAQTHRFPSQRFDLCISRFGTMFFEDPVAAFANIASALRPGARLVLLVWQGRDHNEWSTLIHQALAGPATPVSAPSGLDPFSLADPVTVEGILSASGFAAVGFTDVHEPVYYGQDAVTAYDFTLGMRGPKELLQGMDAEAARHALQRLRACLAGQDTGGGVFFDSRAWLITARRR
jgi:SAM-dependent methyltransferase